jgi:RNA polymerase sigma factor (sigma-70 family)
MENDASFVRFMQYVRAGSPGAVEQLVSELTPHVLRAVRRRLHRKLRRKFDSTDFAQLVWASFFCNPDQEQEIPDRQTLERFLAALAHHKTVDECRRQFRTQRYDVERECDEPDLLEVLPNADPTPSQVAVGNEAWREIEAQADPHALAVVRLRTLGERAAEVADKLRIDEGTVRRLLRRLKRRLNWGGDD